MANNTSAKSFDAAFDAGGSVMDQLDLSTAKRPGPARINVDFPIWEVEALDREADRIGITRQSLIKVWIAERLDALQDKSLRVAQTSENAQS